MARIAVLLLFLGARRGARRGADQTGSDFSARQRVQLIQISLGTRWVFGYPKRRVQLRSLPVVVFRPAINTVWAVVLLASGKPNFQVREVCNGPPWSTKMHFEFGRRFLEREWEQHWEQHWERH